MTPRKKKLRITQISLIIFGIMVFYFSYYFKKFNFSNEEILSSSAQSQIERDLEKEQNSEDNVFYNIEYSGLDLSGNRYILKSKEAKTSKNSPNVISMVKVTANFYFKDNTILKVISDEALYNSLTLDMDFSQNVKAIYQGSELLAQNAKFSNSESFLKVSNNVIINDERGKISADELIFDIKEKKLNISSFDKNKINANVNINEKKF